MQKHKKSLIKNYPIIQIILSIIIGLSLLVQMTTKPVIGVVTYPYHDSTKNYDDCYIKLNTIKWLEAAGADVIPIPCWSTEEDLQKYIEKVNGIYLQTGTSTLEITEKPYLLIRKIVSLIIDLKDKKNINLPLWGSGWGMEILHSIISGSSKSIDFLQNSGNSFLLYVDLEANKDTKMFSLFSDKDMENVNKFPLAVTFSTHAIGPREYNNYRDLENFFEQTSFGLDEDKRAFIASVEAKNYEIFGVQFDPESICYNRNKSFNIPSGINAVRIAHNLSNFFVNISRKNTNVMTKEERLAFKVINSFEGLVQNRNGEEIFRYIK